ncbi:Fe-Mn family superoxide dismutase [Roseomonas sp. GCM10028921]
MAYEVLPLPFKPHRLDGLSDRLPVSHYEDNYSGAVRRLNAIEGGLSGLDVGAAPVFDLNGVGRERPIAVNSMLLPEAYFDALGGLARALERDLGSVDRWRAELTAMGKALAGGSGWVLLTWSERLGRLTNQWAADHAHTLAEGVPVLALDLYEHAYALDFGAKAGAYVDAVMRNTHWERIEARDGRALDPAVPRTPWPNPEVPKVTAAELRAMLDGRRDVILVDVCLADELPRRADMLPAARFLPPEAIADWAGDLPRDRPVVAYCVYGFQVSGEATAELRRRDGDARALAGGITAWHAMGGPTVSLPPQHNRGNLQ